VDQNNWLFDRFVDQNISLVDWQLSI